jgi:hypothetical protein
MRYWLILWVERIIDIDIMITIEMKPITNEVEIPDYGKFSISPFGAGSEAEIRVAFRKMEEAYEDSKQYAELVERERSGEKIDHNSEDYKKAIESFAKVSQCAEEAEAIATEKLRTVIKGKNVQKLFQDFTYRQLMDLYRKATAE